MSERDRYQAGIPCWVAADLPDPEKSVRRAQEMQPCFLGCACPTEGRTVARAGVPTMPQGRNAKAVLKWRKQRDPDRLSRRSSRATSKKAVRFRNPRIGL